MKKAILFLKLFICCSVGSFLGRAVYLIIDYHRYPLIYQIRSAPWYTEILVSAAITAAIIALCLVILLLLKRKLKRNTSDEEKGSNEESKTEPNV